MSPRALVAYALLVFCAVALLAVVVGSVLAVTRWDRAAAREPVFVVPPAVR